MVHGDAKPPNLGFDDARLAAVDWGELTGAGPAELYVVRFALSSSRLHCDLEPKEMLDLYTDHAAEPLDPELVRLAVLGDVTTYGVGKLAVIRDVDDPATKPRGKGLPTLQP